MLTPTTPVESYRDVTKPDVMNADVAIPTLVTRLVIAKSVAKPAVILTSSISAFTKSTLVVVLAVPTISVTIPDVILTSLRSAVSVSNTVIVA